MTRLVLATLFAFGLMTPAYAELNRPLYVVDEPSAPGQGSVLYRIDRDSGAVLETIGDTGEDLLAIAVDQNTGEVIGLTASDSANPDGLVRIDPGSGVVTQVIPLIMPEGEPVPSYIDMFFLEGRSAEQSKILFAATVVSTASGIFTGIHGIDADTGEVATNFYPGGAQLISGADSALAGRTNIGGNLATMFGCDGATGDSRLVAFPLFRVPPFPDPPPFAAVDLALPDATCVTAGTRFTGFTFFGVGLAADGGAERELIRIDVDPAAAAVTALGALPVNTVGIAFGPVPASNVPALGLTALLALIALVLVVAIRTARSTTEGHT